MNDYYSDWDELSDDYYDDDPTVERRQRVAKLVDSPRTASDDGSQTTQRRRRSDKAKQSGDGSGRTSATPTSSKSPDLATFQSVVWKRPDHDKNPVQVLHPDEGEKIALLKNWREVFKNSHPSIGRSPHLRKQRVLDFLNSKMEPAPLPSGSLPEDEIKREVSTDWTSGDSSLENVRETDNGSGDLSNTSPEKSLSPPAAAQGGDKVANPPLTNSPAVKSNGSPSLYPQMDPKTTEAKSSGAYAQPTSSSAGGRKRKASVVDEKNTNGPVQEETKGPRPKRAATKKVGQDSQPTPAPASGPVRRSTRQARSQK